METILGFWFLPLPADGVSSQCSGLFGSLGEPDALNLGPGCSQEGGGRSMATSTAAV